MHIHDDGTLSEADCEALTSGLPGARIVSRAEADEKVLPMLNRYPKCRSYRMQHPLALKLIDLPLFEPNDLAYCDSDVLFLRPYTCLFGWASAGVSAIFMQDSQDAYSLRPWHIHPVGRIRVPRRVNTGLILFRTSAYDLEFIEWFLGQKQLEKVFTKRAHWVEQTCWAALGWRAGCYVWDSRQLIIANPRMTGLSEETVGIHFVASYRDKLGEFPDTQHLPAKNEMAIRIDASPARPSSPRRMLVQDIKNRF